MLKPLNVSSYNCKNIITSTSTVNELFKDNDIVLIQEHWLFQSQIPLLDEVCEGVGSAGKGTDYLDPILPTQMPRGYGGVGILWKSEIDSRIKVLDDGGNRIQCIQLENFTAQKGLLLVSAYLPCRGLGGNVDEFCDCIDQLREICSKYQTDNYIIIGGDLNENLNPTSRSKRHLYIRDFIEEFELKFENSGKTYVNPIGKDCTEIDYFLYDIPSSLVLSTKKVLNDIAVNTSDHHPVRIKLLAPAAKGDVPKHTQVTSRINWKKVDIEQYSNLVSEIIQNLSGTKPDIDKSIVELCETLEQSAKQSSKPRRAFKSKPKLKIWYADIKEKYSCAKRAYLEWKTAGKPQGIDHSLFIERNSTKKLLRSAYRQAVAHSDFEFKQKVNDSRPMTLKLFINL